MMRASTPSERKLVTVLVVDVVGSTALAERMDPEEWSAIVMGAHELMTKAVHMFGGTVAQFTGDGLVAFFGAPRTREDDAVRAVQAALELQNQIGAYEKELVTAKRVPQLPVRVGLHTGMVLVGEVGNAQYSEYLAVGETVTLAQRVQAAAEPGGVALSDETARMVSRSFELEPVRQIEKSAGQAKTLAPQSLSLWRVVAARAVPQREEREQTALIGREHEMDILRGVLDRLNTGRGALVSIVGEAGVGKSRLVDELRAEARGRFGKLNWFEARGVAFGGGIYALFQQILRATLGISAQEPVEAIRERLRAGARRQKFQDPELVAHMFELMLAIDEPADSTRFPGLRGDAVRRELFETIRNTKRALALNHPTVFVLEDMHWADAASVELTLHDADLVRELPIVILAAFRPDRDAPSWNFRQECAERFKDVYVEIELEPLPEDNARTLLDALARDATLPPLLRRQILDKTEGNPFFMEQLVHGLMETGALVQENGNWRAPKELQEISLPLSLNSVLTARMDRLGEPTRRVLQAAAVIGRTFPPGLLQGVIMRAGWDDLADALPLHLGVLERHQLIVPRMLEGVLHSTFKHALIQEAAYSATLKKRRRDLHRHVFETILDDYAGRAEEHAAELAYHAQAGEDWQRAYEWARRAAENADRVSAREEARAEYRRAWNVIDKMDAGEIMKQNARAEIERALAMMQS